MEFSASLICYYKVSGRAFQYKWELDDGMPYKLNVITLGDRDNMAANHNFFQSLFL